MDPKSRKLVATIPVGLDGGWLVGGEGAEYAVGNDAHEVKRIDAATHEVTSLAIDPACGSTPAVGGGFLWMVSWEGTLCKLDPTSGKVLASSTGSTRHSRWSGRRTASWFRPRRAASTSSIR